MSTRKFCLLIMAAFCAAFVGRMSAQVSNRGIYVDNVSSTLSILFGVDDNANVNVWVFNDSLQVVGKASTTIDSSGNFSVASDGGYTITGNLAAVGSSATITGTYQPVNTNVVAQLSAPRTVFFGANNSGGPGSSIINGHFDGRAYNEATTGKTNITFIVDANNGLYAIHETSPGVFTGGIGMVTPNSDNTGGTFAFTSVTGAAVTGSFTTNAFVMTGTLTTPAATFDFNAFRNSAANRFGNLSTRGFVGTGQNVLIGGFVIFGGPKLVLVRVLGPGLANDGITSPVETPTVTLYKGSTVIETNTGWQNQSSPSIVQQIQATQLAPPAAGDDAILVELEPGAYTAIVSGVGDTTGTGLIEVYEVLLD